MKEESKKECRACKRTKSLSDFYFNTHNNNYSYQCKECDRSERLIHGYKNHTPTERRKIWKKATAKSRLTHPEKWSAGRAVADALKRGLIQKQPCSMCNSPKTEAHHEDYSKPLDIIWLCKKCHYEKHIRLKTR